MPPPTDRQLVAALLDATAHLTLRERERATGLSHNTFARFANGYGTPAGWKALQARTRNATVRYLERVGRMPEAVSDAPIGSDERARLIELLEEAVRLLKQG